MGLPSGYTRLQLVTFNGAQYIKTGIKTPISADGNDIKIVCKFKTSSSQKVLFGGRTDAGSNGLTFGYFETNSAFVGYGGATSNFSTTVNLINGNDHTVLLSKNRYTIDGVSQTITRGTSTTAYEIYLGTWNNNNSLDSRYFVGSVYSFTIYNNCGRVLDLIPCKNSSGVVGFYDIINSKFLVNSGTGSFTAGNTVSSNAVTYKTVISKAIQGFNDIQEKLTGFSYLDMTKATEDSAGKVENVLTADKLRKNVDKLSVIKSGNSYISGCYDTYNPTNDGGTIG